MITSDFPGMIFIICMVLVVLQVCPSESKGIKCSSNQISWKNKTTNKIEACTTCPPCAPSQQYTIPCGTEVYIGTEGRCVDCPSGMYSDALDTNPCVPCTVCTNRKVLQNCTSSQNAICGKCNKGYVYHPVTFDCIPVKTEATIKPAVPATKPRTLQSTQLPSTPPTTPTTTPTTTPPTAPPTTPLTTPPSMPPTAIPSTPVFTNFTVKNTNTVENTGTNGQSLPTEIKVVIALLCIIIVILSICSTLCYKHSKHGRFWKGRSICKRRGEPPIDEEEAIALSNDMLLKDFYHQGHDAFDEVCTKLNKFVNGRFDFDRMASKFQLSSQEKEAIENVKNTPNENPARHLIYKLCCSKPETTVRQFAQKAKEMRRNEIYDKLVPYFTTQQ